MTALHQDIITATTSVAGGRIYPGDLPVDPTYPCISYSRVGGGPVTAFEGDIDLDNGLFQFDIFAKTIKAGWETYESLRTALQASSNFNVHTTSVRDGGFELETEPDVFHISIDMSFWKRTT